MGPEGVGRGANVLPAAARPPDRLSVQSGSDAIRRRVYLMVLPVVMVAFAVSVVAQQQSGAPEFYVLYLTPPLMVLCGAMLVWLLLGRPLRTAEQVVAWAASLGALANILAFSLERPPESYYLNSGPYLSVLVAFTFLLLTHTRPRTSLLALGLMAASLALPWLLGSAGLTSSTVTSNPLGLLRLQMNIAATAMLVYLLAWYRAQLFSSLQRQGVLAELAYTDPLTGLPNRRGLIVRAGEGLWLRGQPNALLLLDLDHFKAVNDRCGHLIGDEVLTLAADVLTRATGSRGTVGRWGGEEFLVLLPGMDAVAALDHANALVRAFREAAWPRGLKVTVSVGGTEVVETDSDDAQLVRADAALYHAKAQGRDRSAIYDLLDDQTQRRLLAETHPAFALRPA